MSHAQENASARNQISLSEIARPPMSRFDHVNAVLKELGSDMGMGALTLDSTDRLSLYFDDLLVTFAYGSEPVELLWIYVELASDVGHQSEILQRILQFGFEAWAQNVMTLGLDDNRNRLIGYTSIPVTVLDLTILSETITGILSASRNLRESLASLRLEYGGRSSEIIESNIGGHEVPENWHAV